MSMTKEEYDKYINSDEYERRMAIIARGAENAKRAAAKKKAFLETKNRWARRREIMEKYDI